MVGPMIRIRVLSGCVIARQTWNPGDELEVTPLDAKKLLLWRLAELAPEDHGAPATDPVVAFRRKRVRDGTA